MKSISGDHLCTIHLKVAGGGGGGGGRNACLPTLNILLTLPYFAN